MPLGLERARRYREPAPLAENSCVTCQACMTFFAPLFGPQDRLCEPSGAQGDPRRPQDSPGSPQWSKMSQNGAPNVFEMQPKWTQNDNEIQWKLTFDSKRAKVASEGPRKLHPTREPKNFEGIPRKPIRHQTSCTDPTVAVAPMTKGHGGGACRRQLDTFPMTFRCLAVFRGI